MLSIDTNILLYAQNTDCPEHAASRRFISECGSRDDVAICDLVLVELYLLLRNPAVLSKPLAAWKAVEICGAYRANPKWAVVESAPVMEQVWIDAAKSAYPRRRIIDARLALTLRHHGVTEFATANLADFANFGFSRVWNPLDSANADGLRGLRPS